MSVQGVLVEPSDRVHEGKLGGHEHFKMRELQNCVSKILVRTKLCRTESKKAEG